MPFTWHWTVNVEVGVHMGALYYPESCEKNAIIHNMIVSSVVFGTSFRILGVLITDEILDPTISIDFGVRYSRV